MDCPDMHTSLRFNMDNVQSVDWDRMWNRQMELSSRKWADFDFWYERTQSPIRGIKQSNYLNELLSRMELSPDHTVLDVGCGNGAIAIALARKVRKVTALDSEPSFLLLLTQKALAEGIANLRFVNEDWTEAKIGYDVETHDVVLASRSLPMGNLRKSLEQMHRASRRLCYLTWIVGGRENEAAICEVLGKEYHPLPEYPIIYNMLYEMGIYANIEIFETTAVHRFSSLDEAVNESVKGYGEEVKTRQLQEKVSALLESQLTFEKKHCYLNTRTKWALISWRKG